MCGNYKMMTYNIMKSQDRSICVHYNLSKYFT